MKRKYPYDLYSLIDLLKYEFSDTFIAFKDYEFEFSDSIVSVTGSIQEDWKYIHGDYYTPPSATFLSRVADIDKAIVSYNDEHHYKLSKEDLYFIEKELEKE